jgi:DNA-binding NarL/FixJ family response regulator
MMSVPGPETIRVAIIEDQRAIREGLGELIDGTPGFHTTGVFSSMESALDGIGRQVPDIALVDIGLPGMSGIEGIPLLIARHPALSTVVLTVYEDDERIFQAICAGACGYLLKKIPPERLLESIREVVGGGAAMSPEVARRVMTAFRVIRPPEHADYQLTPHETRLLKLLVEGHNYKTAANELKVSIHTISFHLRGIYQKLQVHSKSEAVAKALRDGILH